MKVYLVILTLFLSACASTPVDTKFDGDWEFINGKACLSKEDVQKLRKILIRCGNN